MDLQSILMTVIAFSAVISVLGFLIHWSISPLKENIADLKNGQEKIEDNIIIAVNKKMDEQWEVLNKRTMEDFKKLLSSCFDENGKLKKS